MAFCASCYILKLFDFIAFIMDQVNNVNTLWKNMPYKQLHESFMQNNTGSSVEETVIIQSPLPFVIFISLFVVNYINKYNHLNGWCNLSFLLEYIIIVVSQILIFTLPKYKLCIYIILYASCIYIISGICIGYLKLSKKQKINLKKRILEGKRSYVTYFRSSVNLSTTICILAVDFMAFPRYLAKTETFGFSLMDTGVGYFVACNALVTNHQYKDNNNGKGELFLFTQIKQNVLLLFLGLIRVISTKSIDYQVHNSEYGLHWNFFLTLAFVKFISIFFITLIKKNHVKYFALLIIGIHQFALVSGVQDWVLSDISRDNLLSANREGVVSLLGYIGIYLLSVEISHYLVLKKSSLENDVRMFFSTLTTTVLLYVFVVVLNIQFPCSRRLVNVTYIVWIIMLTLYLLLLGIIIEICLKISDGIKSRVTHHVPALMDSINYNGLTFFLLANLLTGAVNLSLETLYIPHFFSIIILILYSFILCLVIRVLYHKKWKLL